MSRARAHPCRDAGCEARPSRTLSQASSQPARRLYRILAEQHGNEREFNTAWPAAVAAATAGLDRDERLAWTRAFDATRQEWEACWYRHGPVLQLASPGDNSRDHRTRSRRPSHRGDRFYPRPGDGVRSQRRPGDHAGERAALSECHERSGA